VATPPASKNQIDGSTSGLSAAGQIAQAIADLFKAIVAGIPTGKAGLICRFLIVVLVLLTVFGMVAVVGKMHDIVWGCLTGIVALSSAFVFLSVSATDNQLAVGQQARVEQILGPQ